MEKRLERKNITGYLPYELKCLAGGEPDSDSEIITGLSFDYHGWWVELDGKDDVMLHGIIPILYPMSDLFREIEVNGETITLIAKIAEIYGYISHGEVEGNAWGWDIPISDDYQDCYFGWDDDWFHYFNHDGEGDLASTGYQLPYNIEIMDILNQYHFDYRGLIDKGLAIDINSLPK